MWFIMIQNHLKADHVQPNTPLFTSDSQHPPRFRHGVYLGDRVIIHVGQITKEVKGKKM